MHNREIDADVEIIRQEGTTTVAVIALRQTDCSLRAPITYDEATQVQIFTETMKLAESLNVPLVIPSDLVGLISLEQEVEILPVKSKTGEKPTLKTTDKYFKRAAEAITKYCAVERKSLLTELEECLDIEVTEESMEHDLYDLSVVDVVAHNVSVGAVRRHCENNNLSLHSIQDCF